MNAVQQAAPLAKVSRFYRWLYYRCYRYDEKASKYGLHWANAAISVCVIFTMNLSVLVLLSAAFVGFWLPAGLPKSVIFLIFVSIAAGHTYFVYQGGRYKRILSEFSRESLDEQRRGDRLFAWYLVGSLFLMIGTFAALAVSLFIAAN